jgi:4-nitrophenyl phosphatase
MMSISDPMPVINNIQTLLIDGDGVLWRADEGIIGIEPFFGVLKQRGIEWGLLTNNASRTAEQYVEKLSRLGVEASMSRIFSSATVTAAYLRANFSTGDDVFVIGEVGVKATLSSAGFRVHDDEQLPDDIAAVIVSIDRQLTYDKLKQAALLIRSGVPFIATNTDGTYPTPDAQYPGSGSIVAAVKTATDVDPLVIGKPEPHLFQAAMGYLRADPASTAMLGDRLETDIFGAQRLGLRTIAVLTGITSLEQIDASEIKPDHVYPSIAELADELKLAGTPTDSLS